MKSVTTRSELETEQLGSLIAQHVQTPCVISLSGTLGAGKTRFTKGFLSGLDFDPEKVVSPTFSVINHYPAKKLIHHLDVYRVRDEDELFELGVDELFESNAITLIEWGERFEDCLPDETMWIKIEITDDSRVFTFSGNESHMQWIDMAIANFKCL